jgi:hypothetical protein
MIRSNLRSTTSVFSRAKSPLRIATENDLQMENYYIIPWINNYSRIAAREGILSRFKSSKHQQKEKWK